MSKASFDGYEVIGEAGSGHAGEVYRCRRGDGRLVAVKRLNSLAIDRDRLNRNCRRFAKAPPHPGIVPVVEFQLDVSPYFIAMEWSEGSRTLGEISGGVHEEEAWPLLLGIADALAHLHRHGVHHGNLHPGNLFMDTGGEIRARVADFGPGLGGKVHHIDLAESAWFAAPEQLEHPVEWEDGAMERWDVYRFGVLAWWLINGDVPRGTAYRATRGKEIEESGGRPVPVDILVLAEDMRAAVEIRWNGEAATREFLLRRKVIERCLALDPLERPVDLREVSDAFAAIERKLEAEKVEDRIRSTIDDAESRVQREKASQAARVRRTRLVAASLAASLLIASAFLVRYLQRSRSFQNRLSELGLVIDHQKMQIEILDRNRSQSDHELRSAREAADSVFAQFGQVQAGADAAPAEGSIERENLEKSRAFITESLKVTGDDPAQRLERARNLHHLAHVEARLGEKESARLGFLEAVKEFEEILAERSGEVTVVRDTESRLADCHESLLRLIDRDPSEAMLVSLREASRYLEILSKRRPEDQNLAKRRLSVDFRLARQLHDHREYSGALGGYASIGERVSRSLEAEPDSRALLEVLAEIQFHTALSLRDGGRGREAGDAFMAAMETIAKLTEDRAYSEEQIVRLGQIYAELGGILSGKAPDVEIAQLYNEACRLLGPVHERRPDHLETTTLLSRAQSKLARIDRDASRWTAAYRMSLTAVENLETAIGTGNSGQFEARLTLVEVRATHAEMLRYQKATARTCLGKGIDIAEAVLSEIESDTGMPTRIRQGWQLRLAGLYESCGAVAAALGDDDRARQCGERASHTRSLLARVEAAGASAENPEAGNQGESL